MKQKIVKDLIKILFLFGGIFAFFYVGLQLLSEDKKNSWLYSGDEAKLISYEQEIKLGNLIDEYLIDTDETILLQNELIDSVVWAVRSRLEKQIIMSEYDYKIVVVDDDLVNAFTIPGGRIYIYKVMLMKIMLKNVYPRSSKSLESSVLNILNITLISEVEGLCALNKSLIAEAGFSKATCFVR